MDYLTILEEYIQATNTHNFENVEKLLHPQCGLLVH